MHLGWYERGVIVVRVYNLRDPKAASSVLKRVESVFPCKY